MVYKLADSVRKLQTKSSILAFVFEARAGGNSTTTAFAAALRLSGTLLSPSSSAARFLALLVVIVVEETVFFSKTSSGSDVSGVSGSTDFVSPRRGDTEVLVVFVVAGVLELRPRFLVCTMVSGYSRRRPEKQEQRERKNLTRTRLLISGAGSCVQIWYIR